MVRKPHDDARPLVPPHPRSLGQLREAAAGCTACPLHRDNKQTVFGEGPARARVVLVGEQPSDQEDKLGRPFVGPAGRLLDVCLREVGIRREEVYVTNAVKHFKHHRERTRRIHDKPNAAEIRACRPWLEAELDVVKPDILVCLGATAAKTIFGPAFKITEERGRLRVTPWAARTMATFHPSAILRALAHEGAGEIRRAFVDDLRKVRAALDSIDELSIPQAPDR